MGCDIHCYVEYKPKDSDRWSSYGARLNPGRNYEMFAVMADVRNRGAAITPIAPARGLPEGLAWRASSDNSLFVTETSEGDDYIDRATAESWVASGSSDWVDQDKTRVTHPDWHSHSWLTAAEFSDAVNSKDSQGNPHSDTCYRALNATLQTFETEGYDARLVFWFDN